MDLKTNNTNQTRARILTSKTNEDIKEKIQQASALIMKRNYQAYKNLENK